MKHLTGKGRLCYSLSMIKALPSTGRAPALEPGPTGFQMKLLGFISGFAILWLVALSKLLHFL